MKKMFLIIVVLCSLTTIFALSNSPAEEDAVKSVVVKYMDGVDNKDINALETIILKEAGFVEVNNITKTVASYSTSDLYDKIRNRKLGGWKRTYNIVSVDSEGDIASVKVQVDIKTLVQFYYISLVKVNNKWNIVSSSTCVFKK